MAAEVDPDPRAPDGGPRAAGRAAAPPGATATRSRRPPGWPSCWSADDPMRERRPRARDPGRRPRRSAGRGAGAVRPAPQDPAGRARHRSRGPTPRSCTCRCCATSSHRVPAADRAGARTAVPAPTSRIHRPGGRPGAGPDRCSVATRRLISIVGLGGVGKSRLLFELASGAGLRSGSVRYVDLAGLPEPPREELVEAVGRCARCRRLRARIRSARWRRSSATGSWSLLADEAERCVTEVGQTGRQTFSRAVAGAAAGGDLATTPRAWRGRRSTCSGRSPTPPPRARTRPPSRPRPAVMLLRDRIADRARHLVQGEESLLRLAELYARAVDGVPLAAPAAGRAGPGPFARRARGAARRPAAPRLGRRRASRPAAPLDAGHRSGWSLDRLPDDEQASPAPPVRLRGTVRAARGARGRRHRRRGGRRPARTGP